MPSSSSKEVFLLGGLGNQLWLAAYCFYLVENGYSVNLDVSWYQNFSDYLFRAARVKRKFIPTYFLYSFLQFLLSSVFVPSTPQIYLSLLLIFSIFFWGLFYIDKMINILTTLLVSLSSALLVVLFSIQHKTFAI